jgi:protease I
LNSIILTYEGFQDQEVVYPYYRLMEEIDSNQTVHLFSNKIGRIFGILGCHVPSNRLIDDLKDQSERNNLLSSCDLLVIPGGVKALEKLRQEKHVISFIKEWYEKEKILASTCHGAQLMISAKITSGNTISGYYSIEDDIANSGATYSREPVVVSKNIVSSPHYDNMAIWMKTAIKLATKK